MRCHSRLPYALNCLLHMDLTFRVNPKLPTLATQGARASTHGINASMVYYSDQLSRASGRFSKAYSRSLPEGLHSSSRPRSLRVGFGRLDALTSQISDNTYVMHMEAIGSSARNYCGDIDVLCSQSACTSTGVDSEPTSNYAAYPTQAALPDALSGTPTLQCSSLNSSRCSNANGKFCAPPTSELPLFARVLLENSVPSTHRVPKCSWNRPRCLA